jgi:hypothetical protein
MQPQCRVCTHAAHEQINAALRAGESLHGLSRQYGLERKSLRNHRPKHLPPDPRPEQRDTNETVSHRPIPPATPDRLIDPKRPSLGTIAQLRAYYARR